MDKQVIGLIITVMLAACLVDFSGCAALVGIKEYESGKDYTRISFVTGYGLDSSISASDQLHNERDIKPAVHNVRY